MVLLVAMSARCEDIVVSTNQAQVNDISNGSNVRDSCNGIISDFKFPICLFQLGI